MRIAAARRRTQTENLQRTLVRKAGVIGTAATFGGLNRAGVPVTIGGFPWKLAVSTVANLGEAMTGGNVQAVFAGVADATTAIYIERSISTDTVIAGEGDYVEEEEVIDTEAEEVNDGGAI